MDYDVDFGEELTLFVGKNNAGKTSLMNLMDMVVSGGNLVFDDSGCLSFGLGLGEGGRDIPFSNSEDKDNKVDYVLKFTQNI